MEYTEYIEVERQQEQQEDSVNPVALAEFAFVNGWEMLKDHYSVLAINETFGEKN